MDWLSRFFALAFFSFPFVCGVGDNGKKNNAKKEKLRYVMSEKFLKESNERKFAHG